MWLNGHILAQHFDTNMDDTPKVMARHDQLWFEKSHIAID